LLQSISSGYRQHMIAAILLASSPAISVEIASPREFQVFQRDSRNIGRISVQGTCPDDVKSLGAIVDYHSGAAPVWTALALGDLPGPTQRFLGTLEIPGGGWYSLTVARTEKEPALATVQRFGVGEVFVVAGQSNSTNFGEERFPSQDDRVAAFDGDQWWIAADPMPGVQDDSQGGSPWPACGRLLRSALGVPVAFASCGFGGTSIRQWQKGAEIETRGEKVRLYDGLVSRVRALGDFRAILWHQGESDTVSGMKREEYVELFGKLTRDLTADTRCSAPWIVARVSYVPDLAAERMRAIREAHTEIWKSGLALRGPDTDDLLGDMRHSQDHIHFSRAGLEAHAARWYAHVWSQLFVDPPLK
jgi:hypothetical protein